MKLGYFIEHCRQKTYLCKNETRALTILFCTNTVVEKEHQSVIGKAQNPKCFKVSHIEKVRFDWTSNEKA